MIRTFCKTTIEVLVAVFNQGGGSYNIKSSNSKYEQYREDTYKYWSSLSYQEQFEYFEYNLVLQDYIDKCYYPSNKDLTAKYVADLAYQLNRPFTDRYKKY